MGKLYDLVEFRNYLTDKLENLSLDEPIQEKILFLEKTKRIFPQHAEYCDQTIKHFTFLKQQNISAIENVHQQISALNLEIDDLAVEMFYNDEYRTSFHEDKIQGVKFSNNLIISTFIESFIISKITEHSDWHYPALLINPRSKKWIDQMVAADPLYLTHPYLNIIKEIIQPYPSLYQSRLRLYKIADRNFNKLPQSQFSFVLCLDYLNYLSPEFVEKYILEVWNLLRQGGKFMFSYTNCDLNGSALGVESLACAYASSRWIRKLCDEIGYEIIELRDFETGNAFNTHVSLAILKKPGMLNTIKASQALAEIKYK